jgi:hypothetical protein
MIGRMSSFGRDVILYLTFCLCQFFSGCSEVNLALVREYSGDTPKIIVALGYEYSGDCSGEYSEDKCRLRLVNTLVIALVNTLVIALVNTPKINVAFG